MQRQIAAIAESSYQLLVKKPTRTLGQITDVEAKECHRLAIGGMEYPTTVERIGDDTIYVNAEDYSIRMYGGLHYAGFSFHAFSPDDHAAQAEIVAVVDYLDSIGIDIRAQLIPNS